MEAFGIVPKQRALPKMKECPNVTCKELNAPDAPFCVKCRIPLTVAAHIEEGHRKDQEILELKQQMAQSKQEIKDQFQAYDTKMNEFVHDIQSRLISEVEQSDCDFMLDKMREILDRTAPGWFEEVYGPGAAAHRLTPKAKEKMKKLLEEITPLIEAENRQRDLEIQKQYKILMNTLEQDPYNDSRVKGDSVATD
jgi:hypothetical protein